MPQRPGPPPGRPPQGRPQPPNQSTQRMGRPGEPGPGPQRGEQSTAKMRNPGPSGEASRRERPATGSRPAGRPGAGTGERRAAEGRERSGPGGGGPPRRPTGNRSGGPGGPDGRAPGQKRKKRWKIVRRVAYVLVALAIVVPSTVFLVAYSTVSVPEPGDLQTNQVATIMAADGETEITRVVPPQGNRTDVSIEQIPAHVRNAVIAAEDRNFYSNPGFSIAGFARAARDNLLGKESAGGGSTITQQYVKNAVVGNERSLTRKLHELVISAKMARQWSKDEILTAYLNTIYFGRGAYGIDAAAQAYFAKPVEELSPAEGAVLAASIQLPSLLDPESNPEGAEARWSYVLDGMVSNGHLDPAERAGLTYPEVTSSSAIEEKTDPGGPEGHIKSQVLQELSEAGISEQQLNTEGLQVTTTIDPQAQQAALEAARTNMEGEPEQLRTAVASVDPRSGAVRAYYGGEDGYGYDFANAPLQTGSSFKIVGLAQNLELGIPLSKMYDSSPVTVNGIEVTNVEGEECGTCTIAEATKRSLNTSFYRMQLEMQNGPEKIAAMGHKLGVPEEYPGMGPTLAEPSGHPNNGIVLGQYPVRPLDMATVYGTLAASGNYHKPHFVTKVVTADGQVLLDRGDVAGERRVSEAVADNVTAAMQPIAAYSRNHGLAGGRPSAAKTGTAQLGDTGENKDAWMVGYTPSLATAVWVGSTDNTPLRNYNGAMIYGSSLPSDIWKDTMDGALEGTPNEKFPKPAPIKGQAGVPEWSAPFTEPSETAPSFEPPVVIEPSQVEILPGITIPVPGVAPNPGRQTQPQGQGQPQSNGAGPMPGQPTAGQDGPTATRSPGSDSDSESDTGGGSTDSGGTDSDDDN